MLRFLMVMSVAFALSAGCIEAKPFEDTGGPGPGDADVSSGDVDASPGDTTTFTETPCETSADCDGITLAACQEVACHDTGVCVIGAQPNDTECIDDPCMEGSACQAGVCLGGAARICDDGDPCSEDSCGEDGACVHDFEALLGTTCDDGNACTGVWDDDQEAYLDSCNADKQSGACSGGEEDGGTCANDGECPGGVCVGASATYFCGGGEELSCDDENPCTDDFCDSLQGCKGVPNEDACEDGDLCTVEDTCEGGTCSPGPSRDCDDENACTQDSCKNDSGCVHTPTPFIECDDGNDCTGNWYADPELGDVYKDFCETVPLESSGVCTSTGAEGDETDGQPCTVDEDCPAVDDPDVLQSCADVENTAVCMAPEIVCDDENECTDDVCILGEGCTSIPLSDVVCDEFDGDPCFTGIILCVEGACAPTSDNEISCDDLNPCTTNFCDSEAELGAHCQHAPDPEVTVCDDGNQCTTEDQCNEEGVCTGPAKDCDDQNPCTADSCAPGSGCQHEPTQGQSCDADGDPCTEGDVCNGAGQCVAGDPKNCDDGNPCTELACEEGGCEFIQNLDGITCEDNNACTALSVCDKGACETKEATSCQEDEPCRRYECDPVEGCIEVILAGQACDDGVGCTVGETCSEEGECEGGEPYECPNENPCTELTCAGGSVEPNCAATDVTGNCDDGNPCTVNDACSGGVCVGESKDCDDGIACTSESCDEASVNGDCQLNFEACGCADDSDCGDGNICTSDTCESGTCVNTPSEGTPCDDGDSCSSASECNEQGLCRGKAGASFDCSDGNPCTVDTCVGSGDAPQCTHGPGELIGTACDDGDACTVGDVCVSGSDADGNGSDPTCSGAPLLCESIGPCEPQVCTDVAGTAMCTAQVAAVGAPCSDENPCTTQDSCTDSGECIGQEVVCEQDPVFQCRTTSCKPETGLCEQYAPKPSDAPCDDENPCTLGDHCDGTQAICVAGEESQLCDDEDPCTIDFCAAGAGCSHIVLTNQSCDDGDPCTIEDACDETGDCVGTENDCDDGNPCTQDSCDGAVGGCLVAPIVDGECEDGNACTVGDYCDLTATCASGWLETWTISDGSASGDDEMRDIVAMPDGGFIVVGYKYVGGNNDTNGWIARLDAQGDVVWQQTYGAAGDDRLYAVLLNPSNSAEVIAVGERNAGTSDGLTAQYPWALRVSTSTGTAHGNTFLPSHKGRLISVGLIPESNHYVMAGISENGSEDVGLMVRAKQSANLGSAMWAKEVYQVSKQNPLKLRSVTALPNNRFFVAGEVTLTSANESYAQGYMGIVQNSADSTDVMNTLESLVVGESVHDRFFAAAVNPAALSGEGDSLFVGVGLSEDPTSGSARGWMVLWDGYSGNALSNVTGAAQSGQPAFLTAIRHVDELSDGNSGFVIAGKGHALNQALQLVQESPWWFEHGEPDNETVAFPPAASMHVYEVDLPAGFASITLDATGTHFGAAGSRAQSPTNLQSFVSKSKLDGEICGL